MSTPGHIPISSNFERTSPIPIDPSLYRDDIADRNAIPAYQRYPNMEVSIIDSPTKYILILGTVDHDLTNDANWVAFDVTLSDYYTKDETDALFGNYLFTGDVLSNNGNIAISYIPGSDTYVFASTTNAAILADNIDFTNLSIANIDAAAVSSAVTKEWVLASIGNADWIIQSTSGDSYAAFMPDGTNEYLDVVTNSLAVAQFGGPGHSKLILDPGSTYGSNTGLWFGNGDTGIYEGVDSYLITRINNIVSHYSNEVYGIWGTLLGAASLRTNSAATSIIPVHTFRNDENTGLGLAGANQLSHIAGGVEGIRVTSTEALFNNPLHITDANTIIHKDGLNNLVFTDAVTGSRTLAELDSAYRISLSTSIIYGGEISINVDPTRFNIAAGKGIFVDNYTDPENPTYTAIEWPDMLGIVVTGIAVQLTTWLYMDSAGTVYQSPNGRSSAEMREFLELGVLTHTNLTTLDSTNTIVNASADVDLKINDITLALSPRIPTGGYVITPNGVNLKINRATGSTFGIGLNYDEDKKEPNFKTTAEQLAVTFLTAYNGPVIGSSSDIDTVYYDRDGAGTLIAMPADSITTHGVFFSADTGLTIVHYGQFLYDSLKEAIDSWEKEEYKVVEELVNVPLVGVIAFVAGATDLSDPLQAKFITPGPLGFKNRSRVPLYSRFASMDRSLSGMTYKRAEIILLEDTGVIYADVERLGGGDLLFIFGEREYILDCTTGTGVGGKARVTLIAGTATVPTVNYIYVTPVSGHVCQLNSSINRPTGEFTYVLDCVIQDPVSFIANGALKIRRWTDAKEFDGRSSIARTNERLRVLNAEWEPPGVLQSLIIDGGVFPNSVIFSVTAGQVWQKHLQSFPAMDISVNGIYIVNHPTTPYIKIYDLNDAEALQTSDGTTLADTRFNWVIWGVQNKTTGDCKLMLNLPNGSYSVDEPAVSDPDNTAVTSSPPDFRGVSFLIARLPLRHRSPGGGIYENLALSILSTPVIDLRGVHINISGGGTSVPIGTAFEDALFNIYNVLVGFQFKFDASNLTGTRLYIAPDKSGTLALLSDIGRRTVGIGGDYATIQLALADSQYDLEIISTITETVDWGAHTNDINLYAKALTTVNVSVVNTADLVIRATNISFSVSGTNLIFTGTSEMYFKSCEILGDNTFNDFRGHISGEDIYLQIGSNGFRVDLYNIIGLNINGVESSGGEAIAIRIFGTVINTIMTGAFALGVDLIDGIMRGVIGDSQSGIRIRGSIGSTIQDAKGIRIYIRNDTSSVLINCELWQLHTYSAIYKGFKLVESCIIDEILAPYGGGNINTLYGFKNVINSTFTFGDIHVIDDALNLQNCEVTNGTITIDATADKTVIIGCRTVTSITDSGTNSQLLVNNLI